MDEKNSTIHSLPRQRTNVQRLRKNKQMKEGYKVNQTIGNGSFIEVYNWSNLNEVGHFRFYIMPKKHSSNLVGIWKIKNK